MSLAKEVVSINPAPGPDWLLTLTPHPTGTSGSQLGRLLLRHRPSRVVRASASRRQEILQAGLKPSSVASPHISNPSGNCLGGAKPFGGTYLVRAYTFECDKRVH